MTTPKSKTVNFRENLSGSGYSLAFLALIFIPSLLGSFIIEPTNLPRFLLVSILLLPGLVWQLKQGEFFIPERTVFILLLLLTILSYASVFWARNPAEAIFESNKLLLQLLLILTFLNLLRRDKARFGLFQAVCIASIVLALFSFYELIIAGEDLTLVFHDNLLSSFLFLTIIPAGILFLEGKSKGLAVVSLVCALLLIVLLQSRAVWIAVLLMATAFVAIWWVRDKSNSFQKLVGGIFIVVVVGGGGIGHFMVWTKPQLVGETTSSLKERQLLWQKSVYLFADQPIQGVGAGNWQFEYSRFGVGDIEKTRFYNILFKRPHNDFLSVASELGGVGLLLVAGLVLILGFRTVKLYLQHHNMKLLLVLSGLIGFAFIAFHSFPKERMLHIVLASLLVAFLLFETKQYARTKRTGLITYVLLGVGGLAFVLVSGMYRFRGEFHTHQLLLAQENGKASQVIASGEEAISFFYDLDPTMTPIQSYLGEAYLSLGSKGKMLESSEEAYHIAPYHYKTVTNYGYALMLNLQLRQAKEILLESYAINPFYEPTLLNLSVVCYNTAKYKESLDWLSKIAGYQVKYPTNYQRIKDQILP